MSCSTRPAGRSGQYRIVRRRCSLCLAFSGLIGLSVHGAALAQVNASWLVPASGVWHDPGNWSTDPLFPNNGTPADATYDVTIAATGSSPYNVTTSDASLSVAVNTLTLASPQLRFGHNAGTLTLGTSDLPYTRPPLRIGNGARYSEHEGFLHLAPANQLSQIGVDGFGEFRQGNGTVMQRGHLAVGIGGGSLGSGTGLLSVKRWLRHPSSRFDEATIVGLGPQGTGTLQVNGTINAGTFSTLSIGNNGGNGTLLVDGGGQLIANRMMIGQGPWLIEGTGSSGFGVATLSDSSSRITLTALDASFPGLLIIGAAPGGGPGSGKLVIAAGVLNTPLTRMTPTGLLDVRGGAAQLGGATNMAGTVMLSGTGRLTAMPYNLRSSGQLHISGGTFTASELNISDGTPAFEITAGAVSVGSFSQSSGTSTITGGTVVSPGGLIIGGTAHLTLAGGELSTATVSLSGGRVDYSGGTLNLTALHMSGGRLSLAPAANLRLDVKWLDIDGPATLDLADRPLTIDYTGPSPVHEVRADIARAYAGGVWTGSGITSALADADTHGLGYADIAGASVLVRLTRWGDANLDQNVDLADFNALAAHFGSTGALWSGGDFDYDGVVGLRDFNRLAANFGLSASPDGPTPDDWAALASAVPEPAAGVLVLALALPGARRRRRRRKVICA